MPGYNPKALENSNTTLKHPHHVSHSLDTPVYVKYIQYTLPPSTLPIPNKKATLRVQSINDTLLYYSQAVGPCMLPSINEVASQQAKPTSDNEHKLT